MNWKTALKIDRKRIIILIIMTAVWWGYLFYTKMAECAVRDCLEFNCDQHFISLLPVCCTCRTISTFLSQLGLIIFPAVAVYIAGSIRRKLKG